jgi:hypothetical protein
VGYILLIAPWVLQLFCIIHIIKNDKPFAWIYLMIFLPYIGGVVYLFMEILPNLGSRQNLREITDIVARAVVPSRRIKKLQSEVEFTPSIENRRKLAEEYLACGHFEEAEALYGELVEERGDEEFQLERARALYGCRRFPEAWELIEALDNEKFSYERERDMLVKLKTAEQMLPKEDVYHLYQEAWERYSSFEMHYYYVEYMIEQEDFEEARKVYEEVRLVRKNLDEKGLVYKRDWLRKVMGLGGRIKDS